jgi:hypothetical protein
VALAWLRYRDIPLIAIIGARKLAQLQDNLASLEFQLTREQVASLDEASAIGLGFPHDFYRRDLVRALIYGGMRDRRAPGTSGPTQWPTAFNIWLAQRVAPT